MSQAVTDKQTEAHLPNIVELVEGLLTKFSVVDGPVSVEHIARGLGARLVYMPCEEDVSGLLVRNDNQDQAMIGINSLHHPNRQRFTIAHEIGHLLLHEGKKVFVDKSFKVNFRGVGETNREEKEANEFAAELLIPARFIKKDLQQYFDLESDQQAIELSKKYKVSVQAMSIRLSRLADY